MTMMYLSRMVSYKGQTAEEECSTQSQTNHAQNASNAGHAFGAQKLSIVQS
jgi:hypothetical protein